MTYEHIDRIDELPPLPERPRDGHKGTFGTVGIVGGCAGMHRGGGIDGVGTTMIGAPALCAMGAVRSGCGLVKIAAPEPILAHVLTLAPFATGFGLVVGADNAVIAAHGAVVIDELVRTSDAIVAGIGMGTGHETGQIVLRLVNQEDTPVVIDADGLNALAAMPDFVRDIRASLVLTPHPGEAQRLLSSLSISADPKGDQAARINACARLARRIGCIVVLKGMGTVVSDGHRAWVCDHGSPAMGVGGTGDVLAGAIGSIIAQTRHDNRFDLLTAAAIAVQAHALAGERWASNHHASAGMIATELADAMIQSVQSLRQ